MTATVGDVLTAAAAAHPDREAVVGSDGRLTYGALLHRAFRVAEGLSSQSRRRPVAMRLDDRTISVIATFGALLAGRPLVHLDPQLPSGRVDRIVALADADLVDVDEISSGIDAVARPTPHDTVLITFTSGSTGEPKGVLIDQTTALGKARDVVSEQGFRSDERIADIMPLGFSAGMSTLLAGIVGGATVLLADSRRGGVEPLLDRLAAEGATSVSTSVSLARQMAATVRDGRRAPLCTVRQITFYGEPSNGADIVLARRLAEPTPAVINWYGATEVGVVGLTTFRPDDDVPPGRAVAGRPPAGRTVMVVGDDGRPLPTGQVGEVIVRGGTIARGYISGSADRFLPDVGEGRGYRMGDRGLLDDHGDLHVVGRADDAVKIRGYLVEPAEVEAAISAVPGLDEVFVRGQEIDGETHLVAWVGSAEMGPSAVETAVRQAISSTMPPWMVPRFVVGMTALPRTERGKVDRAALPSPRTARGARRRSADVVESAVRLAVTRALGHDDLDTDQDLVAAGVDSLALARIAVTLRQLLHIEPDLAAFTAAPTIATLSDGVRKANAHAGSRTGDGVHVPLRTDGDGAPLFLVAGAGAPASAFIPLVRELAPHRPVHGLQARGLEKPGRPDRSVTALARRNIEIVAAVQPRGPYTLVGHSLGGLVALEMAAQLRDRGDAVTRVVLIDSALSPALVSELPVDVEPDDEIHVGGSAPSATAPPAMTMTNRQLVGLFLRLPLVGRRVFDPVTQWIVFYHRGARMARRHRLRRIDAPVTVLCAEGSTHRRSWWHAVTTGPVTILPVSGGHVDVLHEPHVVEVARAVDAATVAHAPELRTA
ncbi:MAG: alpha/beta fold hydrolase [Williamsia herbipolensis]|nr:alpha/beta fold hydrolase [Williamsia herbipolensis]